jgi:hypothetical protein
MGGSRMKYISLAAHNNELIIINDMNVFTTHFCYSKKQRHGAIDIAIPTIMSADDDEIQVPKLDIEEAEIIDEDDF